MLSTLSAAIPSRPLSCKLNCRRLELSSFEADSRIAHIAANPRRSPRLSAVLVPVISRHLDKPR
jgi:hypothetical protein